MKVKDLIKRLQSENPDSSVEVELSGDSDFESVIDVHKYHIGNIPNGGVVLNIGWGEAHHPSENWE